MQRLKVFCCHLEVDWNISQTTYAKTKSIFVATWRRTETYIGRLKVVFCHLEVDWKLSGATWRWTESHPGPLGPCWTETVLGGVPYWSGHISPYSRQITRGAGKSPQITPSVHYSPPTNPAQTCHWSFQPQKYPLKVPHLTNEKRTKHTKIWNIVNSFGLQYSTS